MTENEARDTLKAAWDELIADLERAREAIDQPELMPPPASDQNLAEGYRYLAGFLHSAIERAFGEDPARPSFRNALSITNRATIDNADAIYFFAPIDGREQNVLRGRVADCRHWRGETPAANGPKAPHYLIFEATAGPLTGDSGDLRELTPGVRARTGWLDGGALEVDADGHFEILLAPERPAGHRGNFMSTLAVLNRPHPFDPSVPKERYANYLSGRQLFYDWQNEEAIHFEIEQPAHRGSAPPPYDAARAADELRRCGEIVRGQMHFWNAFWTVLMGTYGERKGTLPGYAFPRNAFNEMNAASGATGGGMGTNLYAGGVFELEEDEALVIENRVRRPAQYVGFQLGNLWGESLEYGHRTGSLNGAQMHTDADGVARLVVAHRDPGVPNWLDTAGHREGFLTPRWAYSETPPPEDWPSISATKVRFDEIRTHLPADTPAVTPGERAEQIALRARHVQKRFRVF